MVQFLRKLVLPAFMAIAGNLGAADASLLKPPSGTQVAIVVFEDLQCPECARTYSLVSEAADAHKIPVILHDFPLPMHNWSFDTAVWARYFDHASGALGNEFRKFIYLNQLQVNRENLTQWVRKFAAENKVAAPENKDPDGKLAELVKADYLLGQRIGVEHTPTIWVVTNSGVSQPLVEEVKDRNKLDRMIDDMLTKAVPSSSTKDLSTPRSTRPAKSSVKTSKKTG